MSLELFTEIRSALLSIPAVAALVGGDGDTAKAKIWNSWQRVNAYPCIVIEVDGDDENNTLDGTGDLVNSDVVLTCRDLTAEGSKALRDAVRGTPAAPGLAGWSGTFEAVLEHTVRSATPTGDGSKAHWYDNVMSFTVQWSDA